MPPANNKQKAEMSLKMFDLRRVNKDATIAFIGKRRSGKSFTLRELLYYNRDIPYGSIISGTESASPFFKDFVPGTYIFNEFDEQIAERILDRQRKLKKKALKLGKDPKKDRFFFILDDCLYDDAWTKSKVIREIFMNGRHFNIFFILTMQYPKGIPPTLRTNLDFSFIFQDSSAENREKLYTCFGGAAGSRDVFYTLMDSLEQHECLVFDNTNSSSNIEDRVFYYKANERTNFKMGCEAYWKYHYENYKGEETDDSGDEDDIPTSGKSKNGRVNINTIPGRRSRIDLKINRS